MKGSWDILNADCEPGKSEWLAEGKPGEMPHISNLHCHVGATQDSPCESPCAFIHKYCTFFLLINTLLTLLLSILVETLFCKTEGQDPSLTTGLVPRIERFHSHNLASVSGWEPKPRSNLLQVEATWESRRIPALPFISCLNLNKVF